MSTALLRLAHKVSVVTGAGTGLGRATALAFAREGSHVVLVGRRPEPLAAVAQAIRQAGGSAETAPLDVAEPGAMDTLADRVAAERGHLDCLVASAGVVVAREAVLETREEDWQETLRVNLTGVHRSCAAVLRHMVRQHSGAIVTISSISGQVAVPKRASYAASKAGVIGYTRNIAVDYAPWNIRANCICPGFVETDINRAFLDDIHRDPAAWEAFVATHPLGLGRPEDVAAAALFLCSDEARWITGVDLSVDGGYTAR